MVTKVLGEIVKFEWDKGNIDKNRKHQVEDQEAEQAFLDKEKKIYKDILHSEKEERFVLLGKTEKGRLLYIIFTKRRNAVRIISARNINRKEVINYEKKA